MLRASSSRHLAPRAGFLIACLLGVVACFPDPPADRDTLDTAPDVSDDTGLGELDAAADTTNDSGGGELDTAHDSELEAALDTASEDVNDGAVDAVPDTLADTAETSASDTAPEVSPEDTEQADTAVAIDTHVDGAADTVNDLEADTVDTAEPETDTAEPDADPCPGGCAHLDEPCRRGACGATGCESVIIEGACDDAQACTTGDRCEAGECVGDPIVCTARDSCHIAGVCDPSTGKCSEPSKPNGTECDDADHCTEGEACVAGVCSGGAVPDDSGDWYTLMPSVGNNELVFDDEGGLWWLVSVTPDTTSFGRDRNGQSIVLSMPEGSASGVAVVELDSVGRPVQATLLAYSANQVELMDPRLTHSRFTNLLGMRQLQIAASFSGEVTLSKGTSQPEVLVAAGAEGDHFVARFNSDFEVSRFLHLENPNASMAPMVAAGPGGELAIAMNVPSDASASVGELATYRAPTGPLQAAWVVYLSNHWSVVWQRALVGADPDSFAIGQLLGVGANGDVTLAGAWKGTADWRRVDSSTPLTTLTPFATDEIMRRFVARAATDGGLSLLTEIGSTPAGSIGTQMIQLEIGPDTNRRAIFFKVVADLWRVLPGGGTQSLFTDPPGSTFHAGILEIDPAGAPLHAYVAPSSNLLDFTYRHGDFVVALSGPGELMEGDQVRIADADAPLFIGTADRTIGAWSIAPVLFTGDVRATAFSARLSWAEGFGIALSGMAYNGPVVMAGHPSWTAADRTRFVTYLNSEGGLICIER